MGTPSFTGRGSPQTLGRGRRCRESALGPLSLAGAVGPLPALSLMASGTKVHLLDVSFGKHLGSTYEGSVSPWSSHILSSRGRFKEEEVVRPEGLSRLPCSQAGAAHRSPLHGLAS